MRPTFLLPDTFDAADFVGPLKAEAARWLVSTILTKLAAHDVDARGYAILSSGILERVMGHGYAKIVRSLIGAGVLLRSPYRENKSYGYRLTDQYLDRRPRSMPVTNPVLLDRLRREHEQTDTEQAARRLPIHDALDEAQQGLTIRPEAMTAVDLLPLKSRLCQRVHVDRIERREFPLTISTTRRVFNGLSGVKRDLRRLIRLDGQPIGCVDIRNSQPAILGCLLSSKIPTDGVKGALTYSTTTGPPARSLSLSAPPPSLAPFLGSVFSGVLYDQLAELCGRDREFVKKRFLVDVLAKKGRYPSEVEDIFRREFPAVWAAIQRINRNSHCDLIRLLQRLESWLVIEKVSPGLVERIPIVTLHDAIYSGQGDLGIVEEAFAETLDMIGWQLALKREQ